VSLVTRASRRLAVERDLAAFRARHGRLLRSVPDPDGPVALVVSLSDSIYQLKLEGIFAKALQLEGRSPVFVVPSWSRNAERYFRAFGFRRFVRLEDHLRPGERGEARAVARRLLAGAGSVEEIKELTHRGAHVGVQALATLSRTLHEGGVDLEVPEQRALLEDLLVQGVEATAAAERLLDEVAPESLLFNERNYTYNAPLSDLALEREIDVVQFVFAFQDDAFVFKRYTAEMRRLHPRSLGAASWERVKALPWTPERDAELEQDFGRRYGNAWALSRRIQEWTREQGPRELSARLGLDPAKKTAVLFSHVLWDANLFYGEDLFSDQEEWFVRSVEAAAANDRVNWIVKLHPANVWKLRRDGFEGELGEVTLLRERIGELPPHVKLLHPDTDVATRSIFALTDVGITIRGTVGIELPCLAIPVLTAGTGYYSGRGFTIDSRSPEEYLERLARIEQVEPLGDEQVRLARRHAHALFRLRPAGFTSFRSTFRPLAEVGHPLDPNLDLVVRTREELERADDLRRLRRWLVHSRDVDYLELPD